MNKLMHTFIPGANSEEIVDNLMLAGVMGFSKVTCYDWKLSIWKPLIKYICSNLTQQEKEHNSS